MEILCQRKLRRNNVGNVEGISCWKCLGGRMLRVVDAWGIGQNGQVITLKK